jgi:hypothetical protein
VFYMKRPPAWSLISVYDGVSRHFSWFSDRRPHPDRPAPPESIAGGAGWQQLGELRRLGQDWRAINCELAC